MECVAAHRPYKKHSHDLHGYAIIQTNGRHLSVCKRPAPPRKIKVRKAVH